jgi:hypothetical protein
MGWIIKDILPEDCEACCGKKMIPTPEGRQILDFLLKYTKIEVKE